jgi:hypothetical protein
MQSVPINVLKKSTFTCMHKALHTAARARGSQLKLGAGQLQRKKKTWGLFFHLWNKGCVALSIPCFHSTAVCSWFARAPHSTLQSLNCCVREHLLQVFVWKSISRSSVWKPKAIMLRSFWIFRYQLLPWRKAESISVLHTSVLCEIWSFRQFFWS